MMLLAWLNLALAFALELAALFALGDWGFHAPSWALGKWALGLGAPALFLILWTLWAAPKARRRLQGPRLWALKLALLSCGALAFRELGRPRLAAAFEGALLVNLYFLWVWRRYEPRG